MRKILNLTLIEIYAVLLDPSKASSQVAQLPVASVLGNLTSRLKGDHQAPGTFFPVCLLFVPKDCRRPCFLFDPNFIHRKLKFPTCNKFDGIGKNPVFGKTSKAKGRKGNIVKKLNEKAMFLKKSLNEFLTNTMLMMNLKLVCVIMPVRSFVVTAQCYKCD